MNELCKTRLFSLLADASQQVTNEEMHSAYETFVAKGLALNQFETDYSKIFRTLNITRAELAFLKAPYQHEQGEKCPKKSVLSESYRSCQF